MTDNKDVERGYIKMSYGVAAVVGGFAVIGAIDFWLGFLRPMIVLLWKMYVVG
jgi:hypothetical protein